MPLDAVGLFIGTYFFNISLVIAFLFSIYVLIFLKIDYIVFIPTVAMILWFFLTVGYRQPLKSFFPSLIVLFMLLVPLISKTKFEVNSKIIFAFFKGGLIFTILFVFFEIIINTFFPNSSDIFTSGFLEHTRQGEFQGVFRAKGLAREPSYLAIYLVVSYAMLDVQKKYSVLKISILVCLLATLSLTGLVLILMYILIKNAKYLLNPLLIFSIKLSQIFKYGILPIIFLSAITIYWENALTSLLVSLARLGKVFNVYMTSQYVGSIGSRINVFEPMYRYWSTFEIKGYLFGTGYGNYSEWLIQNYGYLGHYSAFARGQINNIYAAVGLSTGIVGLTLYLFFLGALKRSQKNISFEFFVLFLFSQMAYGVLVGYFIWHIWLIASKIPNKLDFK